MLFSCLKISQKIPSETVCRDCQDSSKQQTRPFDDKCIFIVIDESEVNKIKFINIIVGDIDVLEKIYLIKCCVARTVNQSIICMKIDDILHKVDTATENFLLLLSDTASYMTSCTVILKVLYPCLFHVTYLVHMLHNCTEKLCSTFTDVNNLVAHVKVATIKNKLRQA